MMTLRLAFLVAATGTASMHTALTSAADPTLACSAATTGRGKCQSCFLNTHCTAGFYCCPFMKKCVSSSSMGCTYPIANCRPTCSSSRCTGTGCQDCTGCEFVGAGKEHSWLEWLNLENSESHTSYKKTCSAPEAPTTTVTTIKPAVKHCEGVPDVPECDLLLDEVRQITGLPMGRDTAALCGVERAKAMCPALCDACVGTNTPHAPTMASATSITQLAIEATKKPACALSAAEAAWRMWGTHTCQQMQANWRVCTNENDPNHATVMANCPATAAMARSEPCPNPPPATTSTIHEGDCDVVMGGFHCYVNGGGCHKATTRSSCRDMCLNDAKCQMYEWQPTDGHCCLEHCTPPSVTVPGVSSCPVWDGTKGWKEGQGAHVCSGPLGDNREWTNYLLQRTPTRGCPSTTAATTKAATTAAPTLAPAPSPAAPPATTSTTPLPPIYTRDDHGDCSAIGEELGAVKRRNAALRREGEELRAMVARLSAAYQKVQTCSLRAGLRGRRSSGLLEHV